MQSRILANDVLTAAESEELRVRAEIARNTLMGQGESTLLDMCDADGNQELEDESLYYNALVPVFFR
jgi:hypothetical protein